MLVGWVQDYVEYEGGQELSMNRLMATAPDESEILHVDSTLEGNGPKVDVIIVGNCVTYDADHIVPFLQTAPVIKRIADWWEFGDPALREWLLRNSHKLVFLSELHKSQFPFTYLSPATVIPPPIDLYRFTQERHKMDSSLRRGTIWLGQATDPVRKGIQAALDWAVRNDEIVDFYGEGVKEVIGNHPFARVHDALPYDDIPALLASYKRFLFLPKYKEAFGRTVIEAHVAGCEVITNHVPGCVDLFIDGTWPAVGHSERTFWRMVTDELSRLRRTVSAAK